MIESSPEADDEAVDAGLRRLRRITLSGLGTAVLVALAVGLGGSSGRAGLAIFLLVAALTAAVTGLVGVTQGLRDEARGQDVARARVVWTIAAFGAATLLLAMVVGVAS